MVHKDFSSFLLEFRSFNTQYRHYKEADIPSVNADPIWEVQKLEHEREGEKFDSER